MDSFKVQGVVSNPFALEYIYYVESSCLLVEVGGVVVDDGGDVLLRHESLSDHLRERIKDILNHVLSEKWIFLSESHILAFTKYFK